MGDNLYMGGRFTKTSDGSVTDLGGVVRYDTASRTWHALPNQGLDEETIALAVVEDDLYAGGCFTQTGDGAVPNLGNVAHFDTTAGTWHALPNQGLNDHLHALAAAGNNLYAGGRFTQTGDAAITDLGHIARYDTVGDSWHALPNQGLNGNVYELTIEGNNVYAGGGFYQTGDGAVTNLGNIARYDTVSGTWHALPNQGLNGTVTALLVSGNDIYVGGLFTQTGDGTVTNLGGIARLDTVNGTWHALPNQGLNEQVFSLFEVDDNLYVGGAFDQTGDGSLTELGYIARYDTVSKTWHALPNQGFNSWVYMFTPVDSDLYVGGEFNQSGDKLVPGLGHIARLGKIGEKVYLPLVLRQ
jgi:N-acetylneuraminic acid mutarotase